MNAQTRSWFISAAVASVKFPLCCSCSALFLVCFSLAYEDLFAHKDYKQSLFAKYYKIVDENKIMRDDARFLTLFFVRAPPPFPINKVHQTLLLNRRIFYSSKPRYELQISLLWDKNIHTSTALNSTSEKQEIAA